MGNGQQAIGNKQWAMGNGQLAIIASHCFFTIN